MNKQYLGNSKDSFKWDYHDFLTRGLGYSTLNVVLMMTQDDESGDGKDSPEDYPARDEVVKLCRDLRKSRDPALLHCLPERTGAAYSVELHKGDCCFTTASRQEASRQEYFEGFRGDEDQVVLVDPDVGFEPQKCTERHVRFCEIDRIVRQISNESVVSVFQAFSREDADGQYKRIRDGLNGLETTAICWSGKVMFVLLSQSKDRIRRVREINENYRRCVLSRRPDFKKNLRLLEPPRQPPRILVPSTGPDDWKALLADPEKHWVRGRSARTLAHCWEASKGFPPEIGKILGQCCVLRDIEPLLICPEWKVPLPGGNRPSQNDIWVLARTPDCLVSITIEGKVDESLGPTLKEWKADTSPGKQKGKQKRLKYLVSCLGLCSEPPGHIRYQLMHRAASAVIEAERFGACAAVMLIHSFSETDQGFVDFSEFCRLFGIEAEIGVLGATRARNGLPLYLGWVRGDKRYLSS